MLLWLLCWNKKTGEMIIKELHIDGFGIFHDHRITGLNSGMEVLYGANEAGKSTLLDFIRMTLMGYPRPNDQRRPPLKGGNHGGSIFFEDKTGKTWEIRRTGTNHNAPPTLIDQTTLEEFRDQVQFDKVVSNANSEIFENIYAIGLSELFQMGSIDKSGMKDRIYSLGTGVVGLDLRALESELTKKSRDLYIPRGSTQRISNLVSDLNELEGKLHHMDAGVERYDQILHKVGDFREKSEEVSNEIQCIDKELEQLKARSDIYQNFVDLEDARKKLAEYVDFQEMHDEDVENIRSIQQRLDDRKKQLSESQKQLDELRDRLDKVKTDENLLEFLPKKGWLERAIPEYESRMTQSQREQEQISRLKEERDSLLSRLGKGYSSDLLAQFNQFDGLRNKGEEVYKKLESLDRSIALKKERLEDRNRAVREIQTAVEQFEHQRDSGNIATEQDAVTGRKKWAELEVKFNELISAPTSQVDLPTWLHFGALVVAIIAAVGAVLLWETYMWFGIIGLLGAVVISVLILSSWRSGGKRNDKPDAIELQAKIKELEAQLNSYEKIRDAIEEKVRERDRLVSLKREEEDQVAQEEKSREELERDWFEFITELGLPAGLRPSAAGDFCERAKNFQDLERKQKTAELARGELQKKMEGFEQEIRKMILAGDGESITEAASRLSNQLEEQEKKKNEKSSLGERLERENHDMETLEKEIDRLEGEGDALYGKYGIGSAEEFPEFLKKQTEYREAVDQKNEARRLIESRCGKNRFDGVVHDLRGLDPPEINRRISELEERKKELDRDREGINQSIGKLSEDAKKLIDSEEQAGLLEEREVKRAALADAYREWMSVRLAERVISHCKLKYQETRQPAVIRRTAEIFSAITSGRYGNIQVSVDDEALIVFGKGGSRKSVFELSRGTREQLLLSLRMGLIDQYEASGAEPLPVVLDDVLVNFDKKRASETARQLTSFAQKRQVLLFTCHKYIAELLEAEGARVRTVD
ncbi:MAG: hypothetical protein EA411_11500 [Saprospirales bacterium]|nr:MAG: hypothetical protein EA411_11500 [Saprospirales bacterium]